MWKAILFRRTLRRAKDDVKGRGPSADTAPETAMMQSHPFADLMEKLDRIPYRRKRRWKPACDH